MKLIIAGGRDFEAYELMKHKLDIILKRITEPIEIVSGTCDGADKLGERYAEEKGYPVKRFPANWDKHGKKAGYIRNVQMGEYATHCVCFWDGKSKGTKLMIDICKQMQLPVRIVNYKI